MQVEQVRPTGSVDAFPVAIPITSATAVAHSAERLHERVLLIHDDSAKLRHDALETELEELTYGRAKRDVQELLSDLRLAGFSWRDVARITQVSVPAVQKWRRGEGVTPANHQRVACVVALLDMLTQRGISDPVSWLEMPVRDAVLLTRMDLLAARRFDLVLELASDEFSLKSIDPLLDHFDSDWREKYVDDSFETFVDADGWVAIRQRS